VRIGGTVNNLYLSISKISAGVGAINTQHIFALVAQLDGARRFYRQGWEFESLQGCHFSLSVASGGRRQRGDCLPGALLPVVQWKERQFPKLLVACSNHAGEAMVIGRIKVRGWPVKPMQASSSLVDHPILKRF
jgi:hypothetical protein